MINADYHREMSRNTTTNTSTERFEDFSMLEKALPSVHQEASSTLVPVPVPDNKDDADAVLTTTFKRRQRRRSVHFKVPVKISVKKKNNKSIKTKRNRRKQHNSINDNHDSSTSLQWYTRQEIKNSHASILIAARAYEQRKKGFASGSKLSNTTASSYGRRKKKKGTSVLSLLTASSSSTKKKQKEEDDDMQLLQWFSSEHRNQRVMKRNQIQDTIQAVRDFETATQTHCPEMLAQLLQRHSQPAVEEAFRKASNASGTASLSSIVVPGCSSSDYKTAPAGVPYKIAAYSKQTPHQKEIQQSYYNPAA